MGSFTTEQRDERVRERGGIEGMSRGEKIGDKRVQCKNWPGKKAW